MFRQQTARLSGVCWVRRNYEIAEIIIQHLVTVFQPNNTVCDVYTCSCQPKKLLNYSLHYK